jgi:membrane protease YdiL (CAAX protease family)
MEHGTLLITLSADCSFIAVSDMQGHFPHPTSLLHPLAPKAPRASSELAPAWWGVPLVYLVALALAEVVRAISDPRLGLISHAFILFVLLLHGAASQKSELRALLRSLLLLPLLRIVTIGLTLTGLPPLAVYAIGCLPTFVAVGIVARQLNMHAVDLRLTLHLHDLPLSLLMIPVGLGLGATEFFIIRPSSLAANLTLASVWLPILVLTAAAGFAYELVFRGLLLTSAERVLGTVPAVIYSASASAVLLAAYLSGLDTVLTLSAGLIFAVTAVWSRSLAAPVFGHASAAVSLFLVAPLVLGSSFPH